MRNEYLTNFITKQGNLPEDIGKIIRDENVGVFRKGYGTPELEIKFLYEIFLKIQAVYPEFKSFGWQQCNSYNDEYYHFTLASFILNDALYVDSDIDFSFTYYDDHITSRISFDSTEDPDPDKLDFIKEHNLPFSESSLLMHKWDEFHNYKKKKYKHFETPCLKFLIIIKTLESLSGMYYFLYTFGNSVTIRFDKEGVTVTSSPVMEVINSEPLGKGMETDWWICLPYEQLKQVGGYLILINELNNDAGRNAYQTAKWIRQYQGKSGEPSKDEECGEDDN